MSLLFHPGGKQSGAPALPQDCPGLDARGRVPWPARPPHRSREEWEGPRPPRRACGTAGDGVPTSPTGQRTQTHPAAQPQPEKGVGCLETASAAPSFRARPIPARAHGGPAPRAPAPVRPSAPAAALPRRGGGGLGPLRPPNPGGEGRAHRPRGRSTETGESEPGGRAGCPPRGPPPRRAQGPGPAPHRSGTCRARSCLGPPDQTRDSPGSTPRPPRDAQTAAPLEAEQPKPENCAPPTRAVLGPAAPAVRPGVRYGPGVGGRAPRGPRGGHAAAAVRARGARALPRERAQRGRLGAAGARGRHAVRQRLPPAARAQRARRGGAARARARRPGRGPADAPGAHLRRHGGRGSRRRRLPRVLQERPQPLGGALHRLPHAGPRPQPGARLPGGEGRPAGGRPQPRFLVSAAEVRADPPGPGPPPGAPGGSGPGDRRPFSAAAASRVRRCGLGERRSSALTGGGLGVPPRCPPLPGVLNAGGCADLPRGHRDCRPAVSALPAKPRPVETTRAVLGRHSRDKVERGAGSWAWGACLAGTKTRVQVLSHTHGKGRKWCCGPRGGALALKRPKDSAQP